MSDHTDVSDLHITKAKRQACLVIFYNLYYIYNTCSVLHVFTWSVGHKKDDPYGFDRLSEL